MKKERLTIENRILIEQLLNLNYKLKDIASIIGSHSSTISKEIKKRRITGKGDFKICEKTERYPFVCNGCPNKRTCRLKKYYYNYIKSQENYLYILSTSRKGIDMSLDEIDYWNDYLKDKLFNKNQPILHMYHEIKDTFPKSMQTFYNYVHGDVFSSINDEMLPRSSSYKVRNKVKDKPVIKYNNVIRNGRKLENMHAYLDVHPNANIVEMDTVIGKHDDKRCLLTLYFRNSKLMLIFLIDKYKPKAVSDVFKKLKKNLGEEEFKRLFEVILTDNGWEFSRPDDIEFNELTGEKIVNVFYTDSYSSWQKGGIERNHEFIRYIIPKGITFDNLTNENVKNMVNNINSVSRKSLNYDTPYKIFNKIYGDNITKKLHLKEITPDEVNLSYKLLIK